MILTNKTIFITGWTSGIGRATVLECLAQWAQVAFTGRNADAADALFDEAEHMWYESENLLFVVADASVPADTANAVETTIERFGKINGIFANAGIHKVGKLTDTTFEDWKKMFAIDVHGVFLTLKATLPHLQAIGWGSVVLMGSDQCLIGKGKSSAYGAAKGAIGQLTKSTAIDYAADNIRVNCICPGTIDTPLARRAMQGFADENFGGDLDQGVAFLEKAQPLQRLGQPEEVAKTVAFMLSDGPGFMTGSLVSIDGGYVAG